MDRLATLDKPEITNYKKNKNFLNCLYETSSEMLKVGHRADLISAGKVARPTLKKFLFR